jgi:transcriptional/translational regulatory protein YebC/TACO1
VYTDPKEAGIMHEVIKNMGFAEAKISLAWVSKAPVEVSDEDFDKNMVVIEALEELDDVDSVDHNMSN